MKVGFLFSFLSKFWEIVKLHLITLSRALSIPEIYNFLWREGGGRCRNTPKCPKVSGAKSGEGGMDAGLLFKAGNDLFGRSISGQTRTDLKRDQMRSRYKLWEDQQKQK